MKEYTYSIFGKIWYRYINIILTAFLLLYTVSSLYMFFQNWYYIFLALLNVLIVILINNFYINSYKHFPFLVFIDDKGISCSNFFLSRKKIRINYEDISGISGGMFTGWNLRPVYIYDAKQGIKIGFFTHGKFKELLKTVLQNINEDVYNELLARMKELNRLK
ncbi:MAG: hypothetical protein FD143_1256 [Ignavibacteria bacterium]|nr:MAG: hypothetical protein FD143_1256 [Ignavibacteria bacterium]KAF0160773.1 MAG: hypothetical protein FD188_1378 [Ignavibacteria bacterium]